MLLHRPFDDLISLLKQMPMKNYDAEKSCFGGGSFGDRFADDHMYQILVWLVAWQGTRNPKLSESHICIFASSYAGYDAQQRLAAFIEGAGKGQEPVSKLCKEKGVGLRVLEMAPEIPHVVTENWPEKDCMAATAFGMEATAAGGDILGLASISPGSDYYSPRLCQQITTVKRDINVNRQSDTLSLTFLELMKNKAGREVAAMVGALIAARSRSLPVLVEGWSGITALSVLAAIDRNYTDHIKVASVEDERQFEIVSGLGMQPIIGGTVTLGAGCGIALALSAVAPLLNLVD